MYAHIKPRLANNLFNDCIECGNFMVGYVPTYRICNCSALKQYARFEIFIFWILNFYYKLCQYVRACNKTVLFLQTVFCTTIAKVHWSEQQGALILTTGWAPQQKVVQKNKPFLANLHSKIQKSLYCVLNGQH